MLAQRIFSCLSLALAGLAFASAVLATPSAATKFDNTARQAAGNNPAQPKVVGQNDAPVLDSTNNPLFNNQNENDGAPIDGTAVGTLISNLVDYATPSGQVDNVFDQDDSPGDDGGALLGIAIVSSNASNGTWHYAILNAGVLDWSPLGTPSSSAARLLAADANSRLYFQPNAGFDGSIANAITFRAWDRTSGVNGGTADITATGGTAAFSTVTDTAAITVVPTPVIGLRAATAGVMSGSSLILARPTGTVANDVMIAAVAVRPELATITAPVGWVLVRRLDNSNVTESSLATFRRVANATEPVSYTWTLSGAAFAVGGILSISDANPTIGPTTPIDVESGQNTATSLSHATPSVFTTLANEMLMTWHGIASATTWLPPAGMTEVVDVMSPSSQSDVGMSLEGNLQVQASAGATGVKAAVAAAFADRGNAQILALRPITHNNAPVLNPTPSPVLVAVAEDAGAPSGAVGTQISALVDYASPSGQIDNVTDADSGAVLGIAIAAADTNNGAWFYSTDGGALWNALGAVTDASARVLLADANHRLYFQPNADFEGSLATAITFRAWDQTSSSSGVLATSAPSGRWTAYSTVTDTASLIVTGVNDAPVINSTAPTTATEDTLYTYSATRIDPDGPSVTWSLSGDTCGGSIVAGSGVYSFTPSGPVPPASCNVGIRVCDGGVPNLCATQTTSVPITAVNDAPVITSSAPSTATEDTQYTYNSTRSDADGPGQTWSLLGSHTCGGSLNAGSGAFTFTPLGPTPAASCVVALQVCDNAAPSLCATQSTTVIITAVNDAPVITSSASNTATEDTLYTYNATRSDADGPGQTWSLSGDTCGGSIVAGSGAYTFTPFGPTPPASCVVGVRACDGGAPNLCATQTTTVTITAVNDAPVINSAAPTTATEDTLYTYNATRSDADGPGQIWTLLGSHTCGGSIVAGSGVLTFTPLGPTPTPSCVVAIQVCDNAATSLCATQSTTVTIAAVNDAPSISSVAPTTATEDSLYTYNATRSDADGPSQTWSLASDTCGGSIVAGSGAYTFTPIGPTPPATCVVGIRVCDGGVPDMCATQTTTVSISADNDTPVIASSAPNTATEDVAYSYDANAALSDGPSENWSFVAGHTCGGSINPGSGLFTFTPIGPTPSPSCVVAIRLCDGTIPVDQCVTQSTTVTVIAVNDAPVITSVAPSTASEDTLYTYNAARSDPDGPGQAWSLLGANTCGGSIGVGGGAYSFTPTGPAPAPSCVVAIQVCDSGVPNRCTTQATTVTIVADNDVPAISSMAPSTATEDASYNYVSVAAISDGPSEDWSFGVTHSCGGSINPGTGAFVFTPTGPTPPATCIVAIRLCDGTLPVDQCVTQTTTVSIANNNEAPTLNAILDPAPVPVSSGLRTVNLFGIGPGSGDPAQTLSVTAVSDTLGLIPNPTVNYTSPNATGSLSYTPVPGQQGAALITVTVTDDGGTANGGTDSVSRIFLQSVDADLIFINGFD